MENQPPMDTVSKRSWGCFWEFFLAAGVIFVLAAIAIPDLFQYGAPAVQTEAKTNLGEIFAAQQAYFGEHNTYAGGPDCFGLLDWEPEGHTRYTYWCGEDFVAPRKPGEKVRECANVETVSSGRGFTVCASGNIDNEDNIVDTWSIRDNKEIRNDQNDVGLD